MNRPPIPNILDSSVHGWSKVKFTKNILTLSFFSTFCDLSGTITYQKLHQRTTDLLDPSSHHQKNQECKRMKFFFSKIKIAYFIIKIFKNFAKFWPSLGQCFGLNICQRFQNLLHSFKWFFWAYTYVNLIKIAIGAGVFFMYVLVLSTGLKRLDF